MTFALLLGLLTVVCHSQVEADVMALRSLLCSLPIAHIGPGLTVAAVACRDSLCLIRIAPQRHQRPYYVADFLASSFCKAAFDFCNSAICFCKSAIVFCASVSKPSFSVQPPQLRGIFGMVPRASW